MTRESTGARRAREQLEAARAAAATAAGRAELGLGPVPPGGEGSPDDFVFVGAQDKYLHLRHGILMGPTAVDRSIPRAQWTMNGEGRMIRPSTEMGVDTARYVHNLTWWPGADAVVQDVDASGEPAPGLRLANTYIPGPGLRGEPPALTPDIGPWLWLLEKLWPNGEEREWFLDYVAHLMQRPGEKGNGVLVISGAQGIGKDVMLTPLKRAVGSSNCANIGPDALMSQFNEFAQNLLLVVDEAHTTDRSWDAAAVSEKLKTLSAAPPFELEINAKGQRPFKVPNVVRVFVTTNNARTWKTDADDRRTTILHSNLPKEWHLAARPEEFQRVRAWCCSIEGAVAVAGWLRLRDISKFNPGGPMPVTEEVLRVRDGWATPDDELTDALDALDRPLVVTFKDLERVAFDGQEELQRLFKGRRALHRLWEEGYDRVPPTTADGRWVARAGGKTLRVKGAYVRRDAGLGLEAARAAVARHLHASLDTGEPPPNNVVPMGGKPRS